MLSRRTLLRASTAGAVGALAAGPLAALTGCDPAPAGSPGRSASPLGLTFPDGFVWAVATSAYQIEGAASEDGKGPSIWDTFSHQSGTIADGSTGDVACDHYHRWESDLDLMKDLGIQGYRFSISWPRVLPTGAGTVNQKGLDFYRRLVDGLNQRGIAPLATLYHWDLPQALQDKGGWENRDCASWFADYAGVLFDALRDTVPTWLTINEPKTVVQNGYQNGVMAPGKQDYRAAAVVGHHLLLGHGLAVAAFRAGGSGGRIGIALNLAPVYPATSGDPATDGPVSLADVTENRLYLDPVLTGEYPENTEQAIGDLPWQALHAAIRDGDLATIKAPIDLLGVNYYNPVYVDSSGGYVTVQPTSPAGWQQVYPQGLTDILTRVHKDYGNLPLSITENGVPSVATQDGDGFADPDRIDFLRDHLAAAHKAIAAGVPLEGYHVWSLMDNFEWAFGYTQRWGIVHVDFDSQQRTPKDSAHWYHDVIARNGV